MKEWIGEIRFRPEVIEKLRTKHGLTPAQVNQAVACGASQRTTWDEDPDYGLRLILRGSDDHGEMIVYLEPIDRIDGLWDCLTAWRI